MVGYSQRCFVKCSSECSDDCNPPILLLYTPALHFCFVEEGQKASNFAHERKKGEERVE